MAIAGLAVVVVGIRLGYFVKVLLEVEYGRCLKVEFGQH